MEKTIRHLRRHKLACAGFDAAAVGGRMDLAFDQSRSRDAFSPASTARNNSGVRRPIFWESFERSSVVTWWQMAVFGRRSEPAPIDSGTVVGLRSAWLSEDETGTTMIERQFGV